MDIRYGEVMNWDFDNKNSDDNSKQSDAGNRVGEHLLICYQENISKCSFKQ